jgi:urea transport system permease protein
MGTAEVILLQAINTGVIIGILIMVSMGLGIIYGLMNIINLAHSEFIMLGAYGCVICSMMGWPAWSSFFIGTALVAGVSFLLERTLIRHWYQKPLNTLLATWGISLILIQVVRIGFGPQPQAVPTPIQGALMLGGLPISKYRLFVLVFSFAVTGILLLLFRYPTFAVKTRAVLDDAEMARCLGIRSSRVYAATFVAGGALAGLAGTLIAPLVTVQPEMGGIFLIRAFLTVVVGGVGSLIGVVGGSGVIGGAEGAVAYFSSGVLAQILVLFLAVILIRLRPQGLFPRR